MFLPFHAPRSLRALYAISSERLWFGLAVLAGLVLAGELVEAILILSTPTLPAF
ncbi:MAG: hypothetical protein H6899_04915 [Rhodobacter sp.]|nr:hypothetical protein [Paracoccaceae bacterium]MCB1411220.1 hypothetical protein [Paracoccaceae bacterium]MCC0079289.1 hypothetical protein [Rhodobacter sp.]